MNDRINELPSWTSEPTLNTNDDEQATNAPQKKLKLSWTQRLRPGRKSKKDAAAVDNGDVELAQSKPMQVFYGQVALVEAHMRAVTKAAKSLDRMHDEAMRATTSKLEQKLSQETRALIDETNREALQAKKNLELLQKETKVFKEAGTMKQSDLRIRESLCNAMTKKFIDEMKIYQAAQQKYKDDIKRKATRQVQIVKPDATEEEVDAVMHSKGGRDALYQSMVLVGVPNDQIRTSCAQVAGKYRDILALEQSLEEVRQMFLDLALLVEAQGEILDHIEFHVRNAAIDVEVGNEEVYESINMQKRIRKKQLGLLLIVAICVVVLLIVFGAL